MPRNFAGIIGYSREEPAVGPQSFMSRFAGGVIGMLLATINNSIRFALIISSVAILLPFVFLSTLFNLYFYFHKQKKHNPITSFLFSLSLSIFVTFEFVAVSLNMVYMILAAPFIGLYYGKQDGFLQTIKNFGNALFKQPFLTARFMINVANKIFSLYKFVTLDNATFRNLMLTNNRRLKGVIRDFLKEMIVKQQQLDRNADLSAIDQEIDQVINIIPFLDDESISIFKIMLTYFAVNFIEPALPKKESLELSEEDITKFTVTQDRLAQDFSSDNDLTDLIELLRNSECSIIHECPAEENKVLLFKQYKNEFDEWVTVPASYWVFDEESLKEWLNFHPTNPITRDNVYNPPKYENKETRYKICKVHTSDGGLVCQVLEEKVRLFESRKPKESAPLHDGKRLKSESNFSFKQSVKAVSASVSSLSLFHTDNNADNKEAEEEYKSDFAPDFK